MRESASATHVINYPKRYNCSACSCKMSTVFANPLLGVPLCEDCFENYNSGEFEIRDGNEIYCRWCGQGEKRLILCDTCPKSFCARCIEHNFGYFEYQRILNLADRWCCFLCSPQSFKDLCKKNGWQISPEVSKVSVGKHNKNKSIGIVHYDISGGREKFEIPVVNTVDPDTEPPPLNFVYITQPVSGEGLQLTNNPNLMSCCDCKDDCQDETKCQCAIKSGGFAYNSQGRLKDHVPSGIYECNYLCRCNFNKCNNRVVTKGPRLRLEVFRCEDRLKGWGIRCRETIPAGSFVADYIGEIMPESEAERRGLSMSDEYLFNLDHWGFSVAHKTLGDLGLLINTSKVPREILMLPSCLSKSELKKYIKDEGLIDIMDESDMIDLVISQGERLLNESEKYANSASATPVATRSKRILEHTPDRYQRLVKSRSRALFNFNSPFADSSVSDDSSSLAEKRKASRLAAENLPATAEPSNYCKSWFELNQTICQSILGKGRSVIQDRCISKVSDEEDQCVIDARWYGNIGRFLNHSCQPNLDTITIFAESRDVKLHRVAFFANETIPPMTELCYDYGYYQGNVNGKSRACLCGAGEFCRKVMY